MASEFNTDPLQFSASFYHDVIASVGSSSQEHVVQRLARHCDRVLRLADDPSTMAHSIVCAVQVHRILPKYERWVEVQDLATLGNSTRVSSGLRAFVRHTAAITATWSQDVVEYYGWSSANKVYVRSLATLASKYTWEEAANRLNAVMLFRHDKAPVDANVSKIGTHRLASTRNSLGSKCSFDQTDLNNAIKLDYDEHQHLYLQSKWLDISAKAQCGVSDKRLRYFCVRLDKYGVLCAFDLPASPSPVSSTVDHAGRRRAGSLILRRATLRPARTSYTPDRISTAVESPIASPLHGISHRPESPLIGLAPEVRRLQSHRPREPDSFATLRTPPLTAAERSCSSSPRGSSLALPASSPSDACVAAPHRIPSVNKETYRADSRLLRAASVADHAADSHEAFHCTLPNHCDDNLATKLRLAARDAHEIMQRRCQQSDSEVVLQSWLRNLTFANPSEDILVLDDVQFSRRANAGERFTVPIVIKDHFLDSTCASLDSFAELLLVAHGNAKVHLQPDRDLSVTDFVTELKSGFTTANALSLPNLSRADEPRLTRLPRFRLLDTLINRRKARAYHSAGKQIWSTPVDVASCREFNILGGSGAFSGAHVDALVGTWLRALFGRKLWFVVPCDTMTDADWDRFAETGDSWDPAGRARAILLEANDVLFMPPGVKVIHAVLTLDPSLMQGGMLWDEMNLDAILEGLHWIGLHQHATNEAMAWQLGEVLDELRDVLQGGNCQISNLRISDATRQALQCLLDLGCQCRARESQNCDEECPCVQQTRRCTPMCVSHRITYGRVKKHACAEEGYSAPTRRTERFRNKQGVGFGEIHGKSRVEKSREKRFRSRQAKVIHVQVARGR